MISGLIGHYRGTRNGGLFSGLVYHRSRRAYGVTSNGFLKGLGFGLLLLSLLNGSNGTLLLNFPFKVDPSTLQLFLSMLL